MKKFIIFFPVILFLLLMFSFKTANENKEDVITSPLSPETEECLICPSTLHPGIVESWKNSKHAQITVTEANKKPDLEKRISSLPIEDKLTSVAIGCYECHSLQTNKHADSFDHNGYMINVM